MHNVQCAGQNFYGDWVEFEKKFFEYVFVISNNQTQNI